MMSPTRRSFGPISSASTSITRSRSVTKPMGTATPARISLTTSALHVMFAHAPRRFGKCCLLCQ